MKLYHILFCLALVVCTRSVFADLPPGTPVISTGSANQAALSTPGPDIATSTIVPVAGQPFAQALHVETKAATPNPWDVQVVVPTNAPVNEGDTLSLTFYAHILAPNDGSAQIAAGFEKANDPYTKSLDLTLTPPGDWKRFDLPFKSLETYAAGQAHMHILLGFGRLTLELGGFSLTDYGPTVDPMSLPRFKLTYPGHEADAPWRQAAQARIQKYRMADLNIHVVDAAGKPVTGAQVHVAQTRQGFLFGTAVNYWHLIPPGPENDTYRQKVTELFTEASAENELKYGSWYGSSTKDRQAGLEMIRWLREHHLAVRGHNLVWPSWNQSPSQLRADFSARQAAAGSDAARAWLESTLTAHITDEVSAFQGQVPEWDVINEPVSNHDFMDMFGDEVMVAWFKAAHAADPNARLMVNNDSTFYGQAGPAEIAAFQRILRFLQAHGAPLSGIGLESHFGSSLSRPDQVLKSLDEYAKFGVPLEITEFDFKTPDKDLQADYTRDFLTLAFSHPAVTGFQMWGFWDGAHWLGDAPLFNKDWSLKPSGQAFLELVKHQWWTDAHGQTDAAGACVIRGFLGDYAVTVTANGKTQTLPMALTKTSKPVVITLH